MPAPPIRKTSIRLFIKDRTKLRVSKDAVDLMTQRLTSIAETVADKASEAAIEDGRTTIKVQDVQTAFEAFMEASGALLLTPESLHRAINGISNEALTQLIKIIKADMKENP